MIEYRVWCENADLVYAGTSRTDAGTAMAEAIADHAAYAECDGCGVLTPAGDHGYAIQVCRDGYDVTGDYDV